MYAEALYKVDQLLWDGKVNTVRPPYLSYLGHTIAHPQWAHKVRSDYLDLITSDLAQYAHIPMDGWERKQVVNSILMPRWLHRAVLIPSDRSYKAVDDLCSMFVRQPKSMVPGRNTKQLSAPVSCGGMGPISCTRPTDGDSSPPCSRPSVTSTKHFGFPSTH